MYVCLFQRHQISNPSSYHRFSTIVTCKRGTQNILKMKSKHATRTRLYIHNNIESQKPCEPIGSTCQHVHHSRFTSISQVNFVGLIHNLLLFLGNENLRSGMSNSRKSKLMNRGRIFKATNSFSARGAFAARHN